MSLSFFKSHRSTMKDFHFPSYSQISRREGVLNKSSLKSPRINHFSRASTQESITNKVPTFNSASQNLGRLKVQVFLENNDSGHILQRISQINHDNIFAITDLQVSQNHASFTTVPVKMSLVDFIKHYREEEQHIPKEILLRYCSELTNGFQYLHEVFPDLRYLDPKSIFIDQNDHIRIAGFGDFKFVYDKNDSSLRFELNQVSSIFTSISKRDFRFQGWNLGAIIAGLCTLKPRLMSNIKLYGDNRKKVIKEKLKNIHAFYGKDFLKLIFHLFDPDIPKNDAIGQLKDALSLVSPSQSFYSRSINQREDIEEQKIVEVSNSTSNSSQSPGESIIIVSTENAEENLNENENQGPKPVPSFPEVCSVPLSPSVLEEKPQEPQILSLCESILDYKPLDRFGFPAWKFEISHIPIEHESILGYVPQNLLENSHEKQVNDEAQYETAQNHEQLNSNLPQMKEGIPIEATILKVSESSDNLCSLEEIKKMIGEESKKGLEIKEETFFSLIEEELAFSNEISVITIESLEDFHEENLDMKRLVQLVDNEEDFAENDLVNIVYEALMEKRLNLSRISRVQIRDVLRTVLKMIKNEQISLYELLNNPFLNSQAICPGVSQARSEKRKESLAAYQLLEKGFNPSPVQSSSESDGERSQDKDQNALLSKCLIGKEESNKEPLPSRFCRSFTSKKDKELSESFFSQ